MLLLFPALAWLRSKFPALVPLADGDLFRNKVFQFFRETIREHKETITEGQPRDFIDTYLEEVSKTKDPASSFYPNANDGTQNRRAIHLLCNCDGKDMNLLSMNYLADMNFMATLLDLFAAGSETTSTTLMWSYFLLALHPEAQEKVANEIKARAGSREVLLEDRPQ